MPGEDRQLSTDLGDTVIRQLVTHTNPENAEICKRLQVKEMQIFTIFIFVVNIHL